MQDRPDSRELPSPFSPPAQARIAFAALAAALFWLHPPFIRDHVRLLGWASIAAGGCPIFQEAVHHLKQRRMTMELSMTLALACAAAIGEFVTALVITLFVLVAEVLEGLTVGRGRRAIADLLDVLPRSVTVRRGDRTAFVDLHALEPGDVVLVNPGGRLPVDGTVAGGHSFVDESTITGEPMPVEKTSGAWVHAGSINLAGTLDVRMERAGKDTTFGRIVEAVEEAEQARAPIQRMADRLAGWLVYFALGCAVLTWLVTRDLRSTISVVIVAGACGIAAGTPLAILGAIGRAARLGVILKGGIHLETLSRVDTVVFDKTGTLTLGKPEVTALAPEPGHSAEELLAAAAMAEARSEHPLGHAILRRATTQGVAIQEPSRLLALPGQGVVAQGEAGEVLLGNRALFHGRGLGLHLDTGPEDAAGTEILVARDGIFLGRILVADTNREEARAALGALAPMGIRTVLLTGDKPKAARAAARDLGLDEAEGGLLPAQKQERVRSLKQAGRWVAMVGDGVNDAPAMAEAHVGIAMGSGADVARESADGVLIGNDLGKLVETIGIARFMRRVILQNFAGTLLVDGAGVALAAFGYLNPLLAAFIHVASELAFILNSTRLLPARTLGRTEA